MPARGRRAWRPGACLLLGLLAAACGDTPEATDARYPSAPIRVIVPFGAGGIADVTLRLAGELLSARLGQRLLIENRPGAGGVAATTTVLDAPADGYTLIVLTNGTAIAESLFELNYDVTRDLVPVAPLARFDLVLLTHPDAGFSDLEALLTYARGRTEGIRIAAINPGSTQHLAAELFVARAGIEATLVPYRTTPDVLAALLRNEVDLAIDAYTALKGAIDARDVLPIAVSGEVRNIALPEVPTVAESGIADYEVTSWNALFARTGTPPAIIVQLQQDMAAVRNDPGLRSRFAQLGMEVFNATPEALHARLLADIEKWREVIAASELDVR